MNQCMRYAAYNATVEATNTAQYICNINYIFILCFVLNKPKHMSCHNCKYKIMPHILVYNNHYFNLIYKIFCTQLVMPLLYELFKFKVYAERYFMFMKYKVYHFFDLLCLFTLFEL